MKTGLLIKTESFQYSSTNNQLPREYTLGLLFYSFSINRAVCTFSFLFQLRFVLFNIPSLMKELENSARCSKHGSLTTEIACWIMFLYVNARQCIYVEVVSFFSNKNHEIWTEKTAQRRTDLNFIHFQFKFPRSW